MLAGATSIAILAVAAAAVPAGALDPLLVAPLALMAMVAFEVVQPIGNAARSATSVLAAAQRIVELAEHEPPVSDGAHPHAPLRPRPEIRLHDVSVERGVGAARTRVVDGLDLSLAPGERIVVTGASGAGKSTLLLVLARFLERARGDALLDEHDLRSYAQRDVRREVTLLQQDPHVFDSTLRANVALARPGCTDDEIHGALARAQLSDFVASLPAGLDTRVGASGRTLSGGQRQRLAVARAFLAGGSVLLVDEPTAHLDAATAEALLRDLWSDVGHRSVVLVSHGDPGPFGAARVAVLHRPPPVTRSAARTVGDQRYWSRP
jgi:ABC-type transport system involved in cytochrome bd biosynthesis fused ATPase/permease subunit